MRRTLIVGAFLGVGFLILRTRLPKLHEGLMRRCEAMFESMPDAFPPKRAMRGIEEINVKTTQILELLEGRKSSRSSVSPKAPSHRTSTRSPASAPTARAR